MLHDDLLNDANFILYCAKHYDQALWVSTKEFKSDLKRISYVRKLVTRYQQTGDLKERLILNHIIILNNVFGNVPTARILYLKMRHQFHCIKPFLILLNTLPEIMYNIGNQKVINTDLISLDSKIVEALRKI